MANIKTLSIKRKSIYILLSCVIALAAAYISEYVFGYEPCILCLYERVPYFICFVIALFIFKYAQNVNFSRTMIYFCSFVFIVGALISLFHVGVEKGLIDEPMTCSMQADAKYNTIEELRDSIMISETTSRPRCGEVKLSFIGVSMAGWNFIYSLIFSAYCYIIARRLS